ncbi:unnamed protein product [Gongylonema pulchrum]|uniref:Uncharacterized protein n=1 Tax=Gongylonema pulchrum TaxID=637853 RepID=A0A183F1I1_9BILA|nr:unnamed protein product [Gongylonema pulchrum]VDN49905.1 unnamed protein product [Gongylonema pulchrum]
MLGMGNRKVETFSIAMPETLSTSSTPSATEGSGNTLPTYATTMPSTPTATKSSGEETATSNTKYFSWHLRVI